MAVQPRKNALARIFWTLGRPCIVLCYRVTVDGRESLRGLSGTVLVLPNHPAYVDPPRPLPPATRPLAAAARLLRRLPAPLRAAPDMKDSPVKGTSAASSRLTGRS